MIQEIINYLDELFPNPKCELNYTKDYELLIAVMLSAQTTDKRVNMVTDILFKRYDSLEKLSNADINDIIDIIKPIGTFNKKASNVINIAKSLKTSGSYSLVETGKNIKLINWANKFPPISKTRIRNMTFFI